MAEKKTEKATETKKPDASEAAAKKKALEAKGRAQAKKKDDGALKIAAAGDTKVSPSHTPRLQELYFKSVVPAVMKEFGLANALQVPRIQKIVINCAIKDAVANPKVLDGALEEIMAISGQKAVLTRAKKAIAAFKVREGNAVGVMCTLRRARAYEFLDRLLNVALPRVRDFRGVSPKAFDGRGNYSMGIREQIIFPEVNYDKVEKLRGMTITITTTSSNNEHSRAVLRELGMPFRK